MDVDFFALAFGDEVYFFIVEGADVDFVTATEKLDGDNVFVGATVVKVFGAKFGVFDAVVTEVVFILGVEIGFALDVEAFNFIEGEGITEIIEVGTNGFVVGVLMVGVQGIGNGAAGGKTRDIVEEIVADFVEDREIFDVVFLFNVTNNHGVVEAGDVAVFLREVIINIGASKTAVKEVLVKETIGVGGGFGVIKFLIGKIFFEGKREDFESENATAKESGKVTRGEEGIRTGEVDIVFRGVMKAIDGFFEFGAHLNFVDKKEVLEVGLVMSLDIVVESVVFLEWFKMNIVEIDMDNVGVSDFVGDVFFK